MSAIEPERVKVKTTLKAGNKVWLEGEILTPPLPEDILKEIHRNTGTVEVITVGKVPRNQIPVVSVPEFQDEIGNAPISTSTTMKVRRARRVSK